MVLNDADEGGTYSSPRRRLTAVIGDTIPSYMNALTKDLQERQLLFKDTPPDEIKYWFEYTGPLQVCGYIISDVILYTLHYTCLLCFLCCVTFLLCSVFCVLFVLEKIRVFSLIHSMFKEKERERNRGVVVVCVM